MREMLTIFPEHHYSFCTTGQLIDTTYRMNIDTLAMTDFLRACAINYWTHESIKEFVLAVYS